MTGIKLEVDYDSFDEAVRKEMMETVVTLLDPANDPKESDRNKLENVGGFLRVVQYYSKPSEYKEFMNCIQKDYNRLVNKVFPAYPSGNMDVKVISIRDLPDGGANVEYECSDKMKEFLMGVGLQTVLKNEVDRLENTEVSDEGVPGFEYYD